MTIPIRATTTLFFVGLFLLFIVQEQGVAQDPFGEDTGDAGVVEELEVDAPKAGNLDKTKTSTGSDSMAMGETNAVVRSLRTNPPRSHADLAKAVQLMSRIRRWDEVQFWLDKIISLGINEASSTEMLDSVGSHVFLGLLRPDVDITAKQRESIRGMLELASASSRDPKKLGMAIQALRSNVKSTRIQGYRDLKHAGNRGVAALLESLRAEQADAVAGHIKLSNVKNVLVCGDFNDVPLSYAYHTVAADLKDAFREAGSGLERTYLGPFPSFRIDYILSSPEITFKNY
ncbi:MAG: endonuclease/exonuclease/phosphatase family protein, partial [Pirellula sp.]